MTFRKVLFWMHLAAGCIAGAIVLMMSATGVLLTYERQMVARSDRGQFQNTPAPSGATRLGADELIARVEQQQGELPRDASLVLRSDPAEPVEVSLGREGAVYASPYDGHVLGKSGGGLRETFQSITSWHRWLGTDGEGRAVARAITGASNFAFLFIVLSGMYLWLPKIWSCQHLRPITWFRGGLGGKARDFNWHNVFGFWTAVPLAIVVASALPMSYTWANNLLYQITGSEVPAPNNQAKDKGKGKGKGGREKGEGRNKEGRRENPVEAAGSAPVERPATNELWAKAQQQVAGWQSISMRVPGANASDIVFAIDAGDGGQPQKKSTLTIDAKSGAVKKYESFSDNSAGRQLRTWSRFAHTGEYYGIVGQTIAGIASFAGVMLVWTGISLALRRFFAWRSRRARQPVAEEAKMSAVR